MKVKIPHGNLSQPRWSSSVTCHIPLSFYSRFSGGVVIQEHHATLNDSRILKSEPIRNTCECVQCRADRCFSGLLLLPRLQRSVQWPWQRQPELRMRPVAGNGADCFHAPVCPSESST